MGVGYDLLTRVSAQPPDQQPSKDGAPTPPSFLDGVLADLNRPAAPAIPPVVKPPLPKSIAPVSVTGIDPSKATEPVSTPEDEQEDTPPRLETPDDTKIPAETRSANNNLPARQEVDKPPVPSDPATSDQEPEPVVAGTKPPLPEVPPRDDAKSNRSTQWALIGTALLIFFNIALIAFIAFILFGRDQSPPPPTSEAPRVARPASTRPAAPAPSPGIRQQPDAPTRTEEPIEGAVPPSPPTFTVPKLELIRGISGFGQYDRLPDAPLRPRHLPHIQTYVEMAHLVPEPRDDDRYNYYVSMRVKMYRADVGPSEPLMDTTVSHVFRGYSPRRDFYLTHALQSSRRIQPGEHIVAVRVIDQISRSVAQEQTSFVITSEP